MAKKLSKRNCIGFDPATVTGWAYRTRAGLWVNGVFRLEKIAQLPSILIAAKAEGITHAVIEDCYSHKNIATLKKLMEVQTRIRVACELAWITISLVYPSMWQSAWNLDKRETKAGSAKVARLLGAVFRKPDEADAVCIAEFGNRLLWPEPEKRDVDG